MCSSWLAGYVHLFYVFLFVKCMWRSLQDDAATTGLRDKDTTARQSQRFVIFIFFFFFLLGVQVNLFDE